MLKEFAKSFISKMPVSIQNDVKPFLVRLNKPYRIAGWEKSGRPVPPPHVVKQSIIEQYQKISGYKILVETGTFRGDMIEAEKNNFEEIYSIELDETLWTEAVKRFKKQKHIKILQGDSGKVLGSLMKKITRPTILWLDGHYSAGVTAQGDKDCPIFDEIDAVFSNNEYNHIILIDDARHFTGSGDYPTIEALTEYVNSKDEKYVGQVKDDVIRFFVV